MDLKLSKSKSKYLRSLRRSKQRRLSGKFIAEGEKIVLEMVRDFTAGIEWIVATVDWISTHEAQLELVKGRLIPVDAAEMKVHSQLDAPSGALLIADIPAPPPLANLPATPRILYLDGLQDPGNVGSIIRCAAWFGLDALVLGPGTVDAWNAKVVQASMGTVLQIPLLNLGLPALLAAKPELSAYGLMMHGQNIWEAALPKAGVMVVGNEGSGIAVAHQPLVQAVHIPAAEHGNVESLNAGMATAIALAIWCK